MNPEKACEIVRLRCEQGDTHEDCAELLKQAIRSMGALEEFQNIQLISMVYARPGSGLRGGLKALYSIDRSIIEVQVMPSTTAPKRRAPNREQRQKT